MDKVEAVTGLESGQAAELQRLAAEGVEPQAGVLDPSSALMAAPGKAASSETFGSKVWSNLDTLSVQMQEVHETLRTRVAEPPVPPAPTGDMVVDMQNAMLSSQFEQTKLLALQLKLNESGSVFSLGLGMVQSAQHSARTLLQDK